MSVNGSAARTLVVSPGRSALRLEGAFWLTRPQSFFSQVPIALAAWALGAGGLTGSQTPKVLLLVLFLMSFQAVMFVVNDIFDAEKDRISAPYMPIPSGVVTLNLAIVEALLLGLIFVGSIFAISRDWFTVIAVLATIPPALATMKLYGATKSAWFSPLLGFTTFASAALWAWLLAGRQNTSAFLVLFLAAGLHGIHANVRAQLRDIEGDPKAGNLTLAARLGAKKTTWLVAIVRLAELCAITWLWLVYGQPLGWIWLLAALAIFVVAAIRMPAVYERTRDRVGQTKALYIWVYVSLLAEIAMLGAVEPIVALPTVALMFVWFNVVRQRYYYRLVDGRLAREFSARVETGRIDPSLN
jgi:4-hydroxybenzoate polyprenyltransferase